MRGHEQNVSSSGSELLPSAFEANRRGQAANRGRGGDREEDADDITLIGVTKTVPIEHVADAYRLGMRDFGENYFQEATPKITEMPGAVWHFVGRIQSNKAANIGSMFSVVHTVDSLDKAAKLVKRASQPISVLLEVNIGREPQKQEFFRKSLTNCSKACTICPV